MALIRIYIIDDKTLKGIPGAVVTFLDYDGASPVSQYASDGNGVVYLDSTRNTFELEPGRQASITADGYGAAGILGGDVGIYDGYEITMSKAQKAFPWWLLLVGGTVVYLAAGSKKKVGAVGSYGALGLVGVGLAEVMKKKEPVVKF